jgi:hypothetical protein
MNCFYCYGSCYSRGSDVFVPTAVRIERAIEMELAGNVLGEPHRLTELNKAMKCLTIHETMIISRMGGA